MLGLQIGRARSRQGRLLSEYDQPISKVFGEGIDGVSVLQLVRQHM